VKEDATTEARRHGDTEARSPREEILPQMDTDKHRSRDSKKGVQTILDFAFICVHLWPNIFFERAFVV